MTSIFDLFKIGIGPSSSHTTAPMLAAKRFVEELATGCLLSETDSVTIELYGSMAVKEMGHGTAPALLLGLMGEAPDAVDTTTIQARFIEICESKIIRLLAKHCIAFDYDYDLVFRRNEFPPGRSNGMRFAAYDWGKQTLACRIFYSVGGGSLQTEGEQPAQSTHACEPPYPFKNASELSQLGRRHAKPIWHLMLENEKVLRTEREIVACVSRIWHAMKDCTRRGISTEGILGGVLSMRRAPELYQSLSDRDTADPLTVLDWVRLFAIAVSEENAAAGRVVAAPTNGAAGVVAAVAQYYLAFTDGANDEGILRYFLTAGAIGMLCKGTDTISGAGMGCQGEVGVACSMAAGGLVAALGGSNEQVEHAAEIAMEHNLGMTCNPLGGFVQIPCIERNAFGAVQAVNAARMAMNGNGDHRISLDGVVRTMHETGRAMRTQYKEGSLAHVTLNVVEC